MSRKERRAAEKMARRTPASAPAAPAFGASEALFQSGLRHHQEGRASEADSAYRTVLMTNPQHVGALTYLGILAHQHGHSDAGIDLIRKAIAADRRNAEPLFHLGRLYADIGRDEDAIRTTAKAIKLRPDYADAHTNLGALLLFRHETSNAVMHFRKALDFAPSTVTFENLAKALLSAGRLDEALDCAMQGLETTGSTGLKAIFVEIAQLLDSAKPATASRLPHWLARALAEHWTRPRNLARMAGALLIQQQPLAGLTEAHSPNALSAEDAPRALQSNDLLHALLTTTPVVSIELEQALTQLRAVLLAQTETTLPHSDTPLALAVALAQQCFINEYVFDQTGDETARIAKLRDAIAVDLAAQKAPDAFSVAVLACYVPLHTIDDIASQSPNWPAALQPLVMQQIDEPREEQSIRDAIPALTPIDNNVSARVRAQYEANPYPRWTTTALDTQQVSVDSYLRTLFPYAPYRLVDRGAVSLLIAGCGTGLQAVERAAQIKLNDILAIDLSRSSLAYATRKSRELGLTNIHHAQADILSAGEIGRTFSVIESVGVLHHLSDPFEGWRRLAALLQPGGVMHIALYSAIARREINEVRAMVSHDRTNTSAKAIRSLRRTIAQLPADDPRRSVMNFTDFFSTSECRDLLFHVEEHQFGIPDIAQFLEAEGFDFIGFETRARDAYLRRFPEDAAATRLDNWHLFELENPAAFSGMYQFWVQKRV